MPTVSDQAIVLTRLDYSETSQIVVFFTRDHGKVRAIAKGIKRGTKTRFASGADLLDIGAITVVSREERAAGLATLTEWKHTRSLMGLRDKLTRLYAGQYCADVTAQLTEDWDPHADLFEALRDSLTELADADEGPSRSPGRGATGSLLPVPKSGHTRAGKPPVTPDEKRFDAPRTGSDVIGVVVRYQLALLESIGSMPRFDACIGCGRADEITHFSSHEGGVICRHCEPGRIEKRGLSQATLNTLRGSSPREGSPTRPSSQADAPARLQANAYIGPFDILDYHLTQMMGRPSALSEKLVPAAKRRRLQ